MTLGYYDNFPKNVHHVATYSSSIPNKRLQQETITLLSRINRSEFTFEEVSIPTIPGGKIIFEFGLADKDTFTFIDEKEVKKVLEFLRKEKTQSMDFFCVIRYYKGRGAKRKALKFDYQMLRISFNKEIFEIQIFHERGPRYISPEETTNFIVNKINEIYRKKILKKQ